MFDRRPSLAFLLLPAMAVTLAQRSGGPLIRTGYHLTSRPWKPADVSRDQYLQAVEGICRFSIRHQNAAGAIIDPFLHREHQYATPYFANAVSTLIAAGRAADLLPSGVRAMDHATSHFAGGQETIPDHHGNFFIAALTEALQNFKGHVPDETWNAWRERMRTPRSRVISDGSNNWETYVMKGEWLRVNAGLTDREDATTYIGNAWRLRQRPRIADAPWRLYHDRTSDPDTLSVEAVGRGNLLALIGAGYDGPGSREMREWTESATELTMWLQDPSGQVPANGRTDNHVWVEVGYLLAFDVMAERVKERDPWLAGQFRHAASLAFQSILRWRRDDGSFSVTKNAFAPALRVGYQDASQYSNYNGSLMFHLSEAVHARQSAIREQPAPSEIGGYALTLDEQYATAFANAGGMQMQVNLRGQIALSHGNLWTPLGAVRFARPGWDTRLGPSDGALTGAGGISFAPAFFEQGRWYSMADQSARYEGRWEVSFVHPLLVRCAVTYWPKALQRGPMFRNEFTVTPDGILSTVTKVSNDDVRWGVTWPLLTNDGTPLERTHAHQVESAGYPGSPDSQNFLALDPGSELTAERTLRGSYGDLQSVRVTTPGNVNRTFIYPSGAGDPAAGTVRSSFVGTADGFRSVLGRVTGSTYVGRTSAGGVADRLDLDGDGNPEIRFSQRCGFLLQVVNSRITALETDRAVRAELPGRTVDVEPYKPAHFD